jgi:hypothetical protein
MSATVNMRSKRGLSAKTAAGVAITAIFALATFAGPADARWADRGDHHGDNRARGWTGGRYAPPPVVYAAPVGGYGYYPPPVVYGPGIGINLGNVSIGIR